MSTEGNIVRHLNIKNEEQRIVSGIIAEPLVIDTDGDFYTREGVLKMFHDFVVGKLQKEVDKEHNRIPTGSEFIRTYIALENDPEGYPEGAWIGECKIASDEDWDAVKRGDLNGFSVEIMSYLVDVTVSAQQMVKAHGSTELSTDTVLPAHSHEVILKFDESGRVIESDVSVVMGHSHEVSRTTATDDNLGHSHRILLNR